MLLALLAILSQTPQPRLFLQPNLPRQRASGFELAPGAGFSFAASGTMPTCVGDSTCVALCRISSGTTWACTDNTGAATGSVTQGTGPTAEDTFATGMRARSNITDAKAAKASGAALSNLLAGDLTVIAGGIWHANGTTANSAYVDMDHASANDNTLDMYSASGQLTCAFTESGVTRNATAPVIQQGWAVVSCRRAGDDRVARVNGSDGLTVSNAGTQGIDAGLTVTFGALGRAAGRNLAGPLAFAAFYSESKSDTWLRGAENAFWGVSLDGGLGLSGMAGLLNDAGTDVDFFAGGAHMVSPDRGLRNLGQTGANNDNNWAADPFDVSSWVDVGTPLVGASGISNPFSRWQQTTGCWNLEDNSGAAFEGKQSDELQRSVNGNAQHAWNIRAWAAKGDAGTTRDKMRLVISSPDGPIASDGGTAEYCDFTLDDTIRPYDCTAQTADAGVTTVKGQVLVGNTAATQGSVTVCMAEDTPMYYPNAPIANSTAFGPNDSKLDPTGWPSTDAKGKYEIVFTPTWSLPSQYDNGEGVIYLFDAFTSGPVHSVVFVGGYQLSNRLLARITGSGGDVTEFLYDSLSLTAGQRYAISMEWRPLGAGRCSVALKLNSCSGAASSCYAITTIASEPNGYCPDQPEAVTLGNRYDNSIPTNVFIDAVRVYQ